MGDEGEILSVGGLVTKMKQDNRPSVTECIVHSKRMQGMWGDGDTKEIALSVATTKYLRELESLRDKVESRAISDATAPDSGEFDALRAENARLRDKVDFLESEFAWRDKEKRDELLRMFKLDMKNYPDFDDAVRDARSLIAAVDAACEQPAGEDKWCTVGTNSTGKDFIREKLGEPYTAPDPAKGE